MEDLLDEYSESERYKNDSLVPLFWEIWRFREGDVVGDWWPYLEIIQIYFGSYVYIIFCCSTFIKYDTIYLEKCSVPYGNDSDREVEASKGCWIHGSRGDLIGDNSCPVAPPAMLENFDESPTSKLKQIKRFF